MNLRAMAMKECSVFPKPQHYWDLTIRLFSVISRTLIGGGGGLTPLQRCSQCILQPQPTGQYTELNVNQFYFEQFNLALVHSLNVKTVLFQTIQFSINTQFKSKNQYSEKSMV